MQHNATQTVFRVMLDNVRSGEWRPGAAIPSERMLINEFGVSRIAIREALSMLRGLGVLDIGHGRRTIVRKADSRSLAHLFPLILSGDGKQSYDHVYELRIALEPQAAYLAAKRGPADQCQKLLELAAKYREQVLLNVEGCAPIDVEIHLTIAGMTGNPLFVSLLDVLLGYVAHAQRESVPTDAKRMERAASAHAAIAEAIAAHDAPKAQNEMESHLRFSATRRILPESED